jgi:hypothetical protein
MKITALERKTAKIDKFLRQGQCCPRRNLCIDIATVVRFVRKRVSSLMTGENGDSTKND